MVEKRIVIIADPYTSALYRLLGVSVYEATTSSEASKALADAIEKEDTGIVFVAAEYYEVLEEDIQVARRKRKDIIISTLPTIRERGKPMDVQRELLRALGMG